MRPPRFSGEGEYAGLYLVPLADVRILVARQGQGRQFRRSSPTCRTRSASANPFWAVLLALGTVLVAFAVLSLVCHRRLKRLGYDDLDPIIRIIATPDGYASLSQLQMVLWTFVVAASAVYVMVLSGELIQITTGTLVLLGISGAVTVGARCTTSRRTRRRSVLPAAPRKPRWSDLVVNESRTGSARSTSRACRCCISR